MSWDKLFCRQVLTVTLVTMQRIFLSSWMDAAPVSDDMKFHIVVVKCGPWELVSNFHRPGVKRQVAIQIHFPIFELKQVYLM